MFPAAINSYPYGRFHCSNDVRIPSLMTSRLKEEITSPLIIASALQLEVRSLCIEFEALPRRAGPPRTKWADYWRDRALLFIRVSRLRSTYGARRQIEVGMGSGVSRLAALRDSFRSRSSPTPTIYPYRPLRRAFR